jgi:hypothetical protein
MQPERDGSAYASTSLPLCYLTCYNVSKKHNIGQLGGLSLRCCYPSDAAGRHGTTCHRRRRWRRPPPPAHAHFSSHRSCTQARSRAAQQPSTSNRCVPWPPVPSRDVACHPPALHCCRSPLASGWPESVSSCHPGTVGSIVPPVQGPSAAAAYPREAARCDCGAVAGGGAVAVGAAHCWRIVW